MPIRYNNRPISVESAETSPPPSQGSGIRYKGQPVETDVESTPNQPSMGKALLTGAGVVAGGLAARHPVRTLRGLNSLRQQLMLSGFALPKSMLGNAGATIEASLERGTMSPLKQLFSRQTIKDARTAWKAGGEVGPTPGSASRIPSPGKAMGSLDVATRKALERAGLSSREAQSAVLQAPLEGRLGEVLESPVAKVVHPFRRTPFNQFLEGYGKIKNWRQNPKTMGLYTGTGAVHGAATAEEDYPLSVPLAIAGSARYGLPYGLAAAVGRSLAGARTGGGIAGSVLPVSEYGVEEATSPEGLIKPFTEPAALRALQRLLGER